LTREIAIVFVSTCTHHFAAAFLILDGQFPRTKRSPWRPPGLARRLTDA